MDGSLHPAHLQLQVSRHVPLGADIPVLERFWRLDSRLQVVVHAPPADFPLLAPWAAEERLLL
ncbi:hypothetical protein LDY98_24550, partial [Pseudomonas aeruginosa]|nr:hypothetical protein [Pseudomonas aeruginosa]